MFPLSSKPWNKGRAVEPRTAFTPEQIQHLIVMLELQEKYRELALLGVAVDSMLRVSDLLSLRVSDICDEWGNVKSRFIIRQKKTTTAVQPVLSATTIKNMDSWISQAKKQPHDFIFTSFRPSYRSKPLSDSGFRSIIKKWSELLELDPATYSAHSLRRTKPTFLYQQGVAIEIIALLLGHKDTKSTMHYLGIDLHQAHEVALEYDIFTAKPSTKKRSQTVKLSDSQIDKIADRVAEKLQEYKHE